MQKSASQKTPRRGPLQQRTEFATSSRAFPRMKDTAVPRTGWVREIRTALGLSQSQLAERAGVSRATVQQMERAEAQRRITLASLDKLAAAMDCQVARRDHAEGRHARGRAPPPGDGEGRGDPSRDGPKDNKHPPRPADLERRKQQLVTRLLRGSRRRLWSRRL